MKKTLLTVALLAMSSSAFATTNATKKSTSDEATEEKVAANNTKVKTAREGQQNFPRKAPAQNYPRKTVNGEAEDLELDPTPVATTKAMDR